jgi:hypothetical protein
VIRFYEFGVVCRQHAQLNFVVYPYTWNLYLYLVSCYEKIIFIVQLK